MSSTMAMWDVALPFCEIGANIRCNRCGRKIRTPAPNQRYCSELCRKRAERARWKARWKARGVAGHGEMGCGRTLRAHIGGALVMDYADAQIEIALLASVERQAQRTASALARVHRLMQQVRDARDAGKAHAPRAKKRRHAR